MHRPESWADPARMKTAQDVQSYDMPGADHVMLVLSVLLFLLGIHRILPVTTCIPLLCMSGQLPNSDYEHLGLFLRAFCEPFRSRLGLCAGQGGKHWGVNA